ncbi:hypothetical protein [Ferruginibacter sp.]
MKRIFTFLAVMAIVSSGFAQMQNGDRGPRYGERIASYRSSALVLSAYTEKRLTVMVDNMLYELNGSNSNRRFDNFINIASLAPGKHSITVYESRNSFWGKQKQREIYCSTLFFKPGVETSISIGNNGRVNIGEKPIFQNSGYGRNDDWRDKDRRWDNDGHH